MQTHQRTWWTVENFAFLRRNDFLDEKTTTRNWEHLCHQRKNAVNNWTIIDRQPFEYEAVCNVAVEGKLQNASVTWLSNACAFPFVPITACCVLTLQESAGSTAGSLGLSASIILHIRHIMKKEQSERSLSIYFLQHPSLSTPLTSPWQTAQPAAIPQTADTQRRANIPSQLTNSSDPLPWAMILLSFPAGRSHADTPATLSHLAGSHPLCSREPQKPFSCSTSQGGLHRNTSTGDLRSTWGYSSALSAPATVFCPQEEKTKPSIWDLQEHIPLHQLHAAPWHHLCCKAQTALPRVVEPPHRGKDFRTSSRTKRENKSDQLSCDFMASCTDMHMLLCTVSLITSFQKDRQRNEWVVKHAHKNIIACLRAFVSCLWFTGAPVLHFLIICTFPIKNKYSMCMQFILISLPPHKIKLLQPRKNGDIVVTRFIIQ